MGNSLASMPNITSILKELYSDEDPYYDNASPAAQKLMRDIGYEPKGFMSDLLKSNLFLKMIKKDEK